MRKVGFTGTKLGCSEAQRRTLAGLLFLTGPVELHHGDCIGADADAHAIAVRLGCRIVGHPPTKDAFRAFCDFDDERDPKQYLERNHDIVDETDELVACPAGSYEVLRSGTWATVRYAETLRRPITIILPDGTMEVRNA